MRQYPNANSEDVREERDSEEGCNSRGEDGWCESCALPVELRETIKKALIRQGSCAGYLKLEGSHDIQDKSGTGEWQPHACSSSSKLPPLLNRR